MRPYVRPGTGENGVADGQPKTVEEAVKILLAKLPSEYLQHLARASEDSLAEYHLTLGMTIRNEMGLWGDNFELIESLGYGVHPDDVSAVIVQALWDELQRRQPRH